MKKTLLLLFLVCCVAAGMVWADEKSPTADLKPVLEDLTAILGDEGLKGDEHLEERREKIMASINGGFDFREMSKRVLGPTWKKIDDKERGNFTRLMTKLLENVYIGKLEGYEGQTVEFVEEKVKGQRAQVTTIIENGGVKIPLHYIMKKNNHKWLVYDINIEGVSLVRNYREQFKAILRKDDYQGLVKVLEDKNRSFLKGTN